MVTSSPNKIYLNENVYKFLFEKTKILFVWPRCFPTTEKMEMKSKLQKNAAAAACSL